ncbi:MAG: GldG family protein [Planctomycetota bacterium]
MVLTPARRRRSFALSVLLVAVNLVLFNWIAQDHFGRFDLTHDGLYTLHPATVDLLADLDDLVTMRVYLSEKAFKNQTRYSHIPREIRDLVEEFGARGRGRLKIDFRDPTDDPELEMEARSAGVEQLDLSGRDEQSAVVFKAFIGMVLSYGGKEDQAIPVAMPVETLEFNLAMAITRLTQRETITIGFDAIKSLPEGIPPQYAAQMGQTQDEHDIDGDYSRVRGELQKQFEVEKVKLDKEVPSHIDLLVVHNVAGMDDKAQFYLDQYLMGGGKLIVLTEGTEENAQMRSLVARTSMPENLFAHYGFTVAKNLVLDTQCYQRLFEPPVYLLPKVLANYFDPESSLMNGVGSFFVVLASSIELNPPPGVEGVVLAQSTPAAWAQEGFFNLDRRTIKPPESIDDYSQFDIVGLLKGEFTSYFSNRALPDGVVTANQGPTLEDLENQGFKFEDDEPEDAEPEKAEEEPVEEEDTPGGGLVQAEPEPQEAGEPQETGEPQDAEKPAEAAADAEEEPQDAEVPEGTEGPGPAAPFILEKSPETTIVVVGSSRFLTNDYLGLSGNLEFLWTLVDRMTTGSRLTEVRNRMSAPPSVRADLSPGEKTGIKFLGMLAVPTLVLIIGILMYVVRKTRRTNA